jgi:starch phosphorylase
LQVVYGGKAHPHDEAAKDQIRKVFAAADALQDSVRVVYLEDYDVALAKHFCPGVDVWLNTPEKPYEASGTSGMKAALNCVPSLSVLDGWWLEGHIEGVTGWAIGTDAPAEENVENEVKSMYDKLEDVIIPLFYKHPDSFAEVMRSAAAYNGSFFNTQRMLIQYMRNVYRLDPDEKT